MQPTASWGSLWMPLSLAYTASLLRKNGHEIKLIDCQARNIDYRGILDQIILISPSLVVLSTGFPSIKGDMQTANEIKQFRPEIKVAVFGMYPTILLDRALDECPAIDFAIMGEPEWVVCSLANSIENNRPLDTIKGLIYRKSNQIIVNQPQDFRENDINELPFPARDLLDNDSYRLVESNDKFTHINIARGCPYKCTFCTAAKYNGAYFRRRKTDSIISEIEECITLYAIHNYVFWFEENSSDRNFAEGLCDAIIERRLSINWFARSRVDNLTLNLLKKMKHSGCKGISLGIESVDQHILDNVQKGITVTQISKAIMMAKEAGISTTGHFIFGLPGETKETAYRTINFAKNSGLDLAQFYCAVPYPQTQFGDFAKRNGWIITDDYSKYHLSESVASNEHLNPEEIVELRREAYKSFYLSPKFYWKALKLTIINKSVQPIRNFRRWSNP